jgi:hypothetical protein
MTLVLADILAAAPVGTIDVSGLSRTGHLDALRAFRPELAWPATHAARSVRWLPGCRS